MPKEIDETKLNYNKYPGEHVLAVGEVVKVGEKTFHLVENYHDAFDAEKLEQRFSNIFDKYDYIVGDWGFEQLRLKGFFSESRKKMQSENRIDRLEDYLNEYCNYGCAYFVLRRIRSKDEKDQAYSEERLFEEGERKPKFDKARRRRPRRNKSDKREPEQSNSQKSNNGNNKSKQNFAMHDKSDKRKADFSKKNSNSKNRPAKNKKPSPAQNNSSKKAGFVMRERS